MDVDPDIVNWVLEFLLRQPHEEGTLESLLRILPLPNDNRNLKKLFLLKKLELEASGDEISEDTLGLLEQLGELNFQEGREGLSDAMKRAYCAVAVECTVKTLVNKDVGDKMCRLNYIEAVKRVWRVRIGGMEKSGDRRGLGSEDLWAWKKEVEDAVWDDDIYDIVIKKSQEVNATEAIDSYLREEREKMGPSFLELVAHRVKVDGLMQGMLGVGSVDQISGNEEPLRGSDLIEDHGNQVEIQKGETHLRNKLICVRRSRRLAFGSSNGAKLVDSDEMEAMPSSRNYNLPHSAEVTRVQKSLESSAMELHAVVKDPLPEALKLTEAIVDKAGDNDLHDPVENCVKSNAVGGAGVVQAIVCDATRNDEHHDHVEANGVEYSIVNGARVDKSTGCNVSNMPSLMGRNTTAHTYEWDDSIERSEQNPTDHRSRFQLPSPVALKASPLQGFINNNLVRRKRKYWSVSEEDTLREGVQKYGAGNWKFILAAYRETFVNRTEVDLKDKWRNLSRQWRNH